MSHLGRLPTHTILDPLTAFRSAAVGPPRTVTSPAEWPLTAGGFRSRSALEKGRHRQRHPVIDCCRQILGTRRRGLLRNSDVVTKGPPVAGGGQIGRGSALPAETQAFLVGLDSDCWHLATATWWLHRPEHTCDLWLEFAKSLIIWCPQSESNQRLMITNQLHDLHATGARSVLHGLIIAQAHASVPPCRLPGKSHGALPANASQQQASAGHAAESSGKGQLLCHWPIGGADRPAHSFAVVDRLLESP